MSSQFSIAEDVASAISGQAVFDLTAAIATEERLSGSDGEKRAFDQIQAMLDKGGFMTQLLPHDAYISLPRSASIEIAGEGLPAITHSFSTSTSGTVAAVADLGWDAPAGGTAQGRITLCDGIAMHGLVSRNQRAGCIGQIFVCGDVTHEMCVSAVWGSPGRDDVSKLPMTPVVSVTTDVGQRIRTLLAEGATELKLVTDVDTGWKKLHVLVADLMPAEADGGAASQMPFVLFSGHLDSWHLGAMDNGSANATMVAVGLEMAKRRKSLRRGLRLAFWSGHSHGRYAGSAWYVDQYHHELSTRCLVHVNVDSVGGKGASVLAEAIAMASTLECGAEAIRAVSGQKFHGAPIPRAGDQSLVQLGTPSLFMSLSEQPPSDTITARAFGALIAGSKTGGLGWWWHTTEDTLDKLDVDLLERDARIYARVLASLLCDPVMPIRPDRQAETLLEKLQELQSKCSAWIDLSRTVALAEQAVEAMRDLQARRRARGKETAFQTACVVHAMRPLVELRHAGSGPYDHDIAAPLKPIPPLALGWELEGMEEAERRFALVTLKRRCNYVEDRIRSAIAMARAVSL